jgi:hypothetical protein
MPAVYDMARQAVQPMRMHVSLYRGMWPKLKINSKTTILELTS